LFFGRSREASRLASGTLRDPAGVAGRVLRGLADVDQHGALAIDQLHRVGSRDLHAGGRSLRQDRPDQQAAGDERGGEEVPVLDEEIHGLRPLGKSTIIEFALSRPAAAWHFLIQRPVCPMHKLVMIRHGESTWNLENRFTGWTDVELTPTGVARPVPPGGC
jgi:hypothetical protein